MMRSRNLNSNPKNILIAFVLGVFPLALHAQKSDLTLLFQDQTALDTKLTVSIKGIKKKTNDSTYLDSYFHIKGENGAWDSVKIKIRARGVFRRATCYFAPLKIKVSKSNAKETILEGNKSLKLVLPCNNNDTKNDLVIKEFICYKIYEQLSPYYFNTRLTNIDFTEEEIKKSKNFKLTGILIEDDDLVAKRHGGKIMENMKLTPAGLNDTTALIHDIFQFMIGNTDWSTTFLHNSKLLFQAPKKFTPLAYDFDMTGFVNPPYAVVNADLGISNVRERLYRGVCRNESAVQWVRKLYLSKEPAIMSVIAQYEKQLSPKDYKDIRGYTEEFFAVMKDDRSFKVYILDKCR